VITLPHLETNVTIACQLRCVSCNHFVALQTNEARKRLADPLQVYDDLSALSKFVHVDAWGALGGEPLLHPNLLEVLTAVTKTRIADVMEVWTNGIAVRQKMTSALWDAFDRLVVSVYPGTLDDAEIEWIKSAAQEACVDVQIKDERHVPNFERLLEPTRTNAVDTSRKYHACFFKDYSRVADRGYFYRCCTSPFIPRLLLGLEEGTDGIRIDTLTESALLQFLNQQEAPASCQVCSGLDPAIRRRTDWKEERNPEAWLVASKSERIQ
jgi:organic radical activating enzyme